MVLSYGIFFNEMINTKISKTDHHAKIVMRAEMIDTKLDKIVMRAEHEIRNYCSQNRAEHEIRNTVRKIVLNTKLGKIVLNTKLGITVRKIVLNRFPVQSCHQ